MKKNKFKVGDRVAVYETGRRKTGIIKEVDESVIAQSIFVNLDEDPDECSGIWFHPKQCRRLRFREKRRFWINPQSPLLKFGFTNTFSVVKQEGWIEFVEVKKGKKK